MAMMIVMAMPMTAFAEESDSTLISSEKVTLTLPYGKSRSVESKEFTINTYNDNGVTVYSIDVEDPEYRLAAMEYINNLTGDVNSENKTRGVLLPGESEYHNDTDDDGEARSYSWARNTVSIGKNNFEGGQSGLWLGSGNCEYIVLQESITVKGIGYTVSWPTGFSASGSSSSASWTSNPRYANVTGASFNGFVISSGATSCTFSNGADIYTSSRIYRPMNYLKFSYFS